MRRAPAALETAEGLPQGLCHLRPLRGRVTVPGTMFQPARRAPLHRVFAGRSANQVTPGPSSYCCVFKVLPVFRIQVFLRHGHCKPFQLVRGLFISTVSIKQH